VVWFAENRNLEAIRRWKNFDDILSRSHIILDLERTDRHIATAKKEALCIASRGKKYCQQYAIQCWLCQVVDCLLHDYIIIIVFRNSYTEYCTWHNRRNLVWKSSVLDSTEKRWLVCKMALICKNWLTLRLGLGLAFRHRKDKGQIFYRYGPITGKGRR